MTSDFDRIRDVALAHGHCIRTRSNGAYQVVYAKGKVYDDTPRLIVSKSKRTDFAFIVHSAYVDGTDTRLTVDQAVEMITSGGLARVSYYDRIRRDAEAADLVVKDTGPNLFLVTRHDSSPVADTPFLLVASDILHESTGALYCAAGKEDVILSAAGAIEMIGAGKL